MEEKKLKILAKDIFYNWTAINFIRIESWENGYKNYKL